MIIFKTEDHPGAWDINGVKILCESYVENWDYEIKGKYGEGLELLKICIRTIFVNPDKKYLLKFGEATVYPSNYDEETCGIIDVLNLKVEKQCVYEDNKIISFCLYGDNPLYFKGAIKNLEQYQKTYPDCKCYFYVRQGDVSDVMIDELESKGGKVIKCVNNVNWFMMFTRFLPFENKNNEFYLSRDTDGRLIHREVKAIEQWIESGKKFHIIRDHPWHNAPILGGMWGAKNLNLKNIRLMIMQWCLMYINQDESNEKQKGPDQFFLTNMYKLVKDEIFSQDEFFTFEDLSEIIDAPRNDNEYIGEPYDENDNVLDPKLRELFDKE
jgi:hypothetical protein